MLGRLRTMIEEMHWEDAASPSRWVQFARRQVRLYFYTLRELVRNRCPQQAAALTFTTLLALVPLFAVAFSIFRGFAALEGVERRAQDVIFRTILAGPLLESRALTGAGPEASTDIAADVEGMTGPQVLAEADSRPRTEGVGATLSLYLTALERGADPQAVRLGMSTLRMASVGSLRKVLALHPLGVQRQYAEAAGVQDFARSGAEELGETLFRQAGDYVIEGRYAEALDILTAAEHAGHSAFKVRVAAAKAREALADTLLAQGAAEDAAGGYRLALLSYCDALVLGNRDEDAQVLTGIAERQSGALDKLGEVLLEIGKRDLAVHEALPPGQQESRDETFRTALRGLHEAADVLEHSSEVRYLLGNLYDEAGRSPEASEQYRRAFEKRREAAARGISLAVVDHIRSFVSKVGRLEIGALGVLLLIVTATLLLNTIERTLNSIWQVTERRPYWIKFTSFCTLIWLGPALIGSSVWVQERLGAYVRDKLGDVAVLGEVVQLATSAMEFVLPFVTTWLALLAIYKFLPHTRVRWGSAAWGAFVSAALLQGARPLYSMYVLKAVRYERIYGSLGAVPIFLLWVWLLWMIVLFGAEVSFTIQNVNLLRYRDKLHRLSRIFIDRYLAARIMMYVAREFWDTGGPVTSQRLGEILQITPEEAADAAGRLVRLGLLTPVGEERDEFHPARDLSRLRLSDMLSVTDHFRDQSRSGRPEDKAYEDALERSFRTAIEAQEQALAGMTVQDLLRECEPDRGREPSDPAAT